MANDKSTSTGTLGLFIKRENVIKAFLHSRSGGSLPQGHFVIASGVNEL